MFAKQILYHLSHTFGLFALVIFEDAFSGTICPSLKTLEHENRGILEKGNE
jgi:hypothetical protein